MGDGQRAEGHVWSQATQHSSCLCITTHHHRRPHHRVSDSFLIHSSPIRLSSPSNMTEMSPASSRMARIKNRVQKRCPLSKLPDELLEMIIQERHCRKPWPNALSDRDVPGQQIHPQALPRESFSHRLLASKGRHYTCRSAATLRCGCSAKRI